MVLPNSHGDLCEKAGCSRQELGASEECGKLLGLTQRHGRMVEAPTRKGVKRDFFAGVPWGGCWGDEGIAVEPRGGAWDRGLVMDKEEH